ncbi:MAG: co-chaperone GroES [Bdellovibrionales bacterium]|nr:co-chaperone GroES [Bdellovibrionales bacterium]
MNKKDKKIVSNLEIKEEKEMLKSLKTNASHSSGYSKSIRRINPLGMRVVVRLLKDRNLSEGGLYLPEGAKEAMSESLLAEVIEVASAVDMDTDEEANISGVPLAAKVLIPKDCGTRVPWDNELRIVETKDILAIVNEISIT